jgi:peptide/nickel transport system substrate-binding protein
MVDFNKDDAKILIEDYMQRAGVTAGSSDLKYTFTIAGSNLQDHPTYKTFRDAAALLNELGWTITVQADTQALTKLSTGSLEVWAAAWGSTIDPDLYQVYHKNSTATSTLAWGYPSIKSSGSKEEQDILNELSKVIEEARETDKRADRIEFYREAMGYILDLAIELPVYQRSVVYVYNANVIDASSLPEASNPYSSPLDRIWELDFVK